LIFLSTINHRPSTSLPRKKPPRFPGTALMLDGHGG
jgi:hypothetical protein